MDDFKNMIPPQASVKRGNEWKDVEAKELVPGDVVKIRLGSQIPADVILLISKEMKVNNASLTGEAEELLRDPEEKAENIYESPNVAFFGTSCTNGEGQGIVFRTGDDTAIGRIANLTDSAENKQTPLSHEIERFIILISIVAVVLGVSFFLYGLLIVEYAPVDMLVFAIGIIVANVPEGLLATVTVSLALTAKRMHAKMVLVKNLESVETLGSTSCICSDKTGTLTQNRMTVSHMWMGKEIINAELNWESYKKTLESEQKKKDRGENGEPEKVKEPNYNLGDKLFRELIKTLALSTVTYFAFEPAVDEVKEWMRKDEKKTGRKSTAFPKDRKEWGPELERLFEDGRARMQEEEKGRRFLKRMTKGDASETGIVRFITPLLMTEYDGIWDQAGVADFPDRLAQFRAAFPPLRDSKGSDVGIPFNSSIKFNVLIRDANPGENNPRTTKDNATIYLKGAPEKVLKRCSKVLVQDGSSEPYPVEFDAAMQFNVNAANDRFGLMGERVLAFAKTELDPRDFPKSSYVFDTPGWNSWGDDKADQIDTRLES